MDTWSTAGFPARHRASIAPAWPLPPETLTLPWGAEHFDRMGPERLAGAAAALLARGGSLILFGPRGTGKTELATWLGLNVLVVADWGPTLPTAQYVSWPDLAAQEKASFDGEALSPLAAARKASLLVIDEATIRSPFELELFTELVDHRYGALRRTLVACHLSERELEANFGSSAFSRLQETGGAVKCAWEGYR